MFSGDVQRRIIAQKTRYAERKRCERTASDPVLERLEIEKRRNHIEEKIIEESSNRSERKVANGKAKIRREEESLSTETSPVVSSTRAKSICRRKVKRGKLIIEEQETIGV